MSLQKSSLIGDKSPNLVTLPLAPDESQFIGSHKSKFSFAAKTFFLTKNAPFSSINQGEGLYYKVFLLQLQNIKCCKIVNLFLPATSTLSINILFLVRKQWWRPEWGIIYWNDIQRQTSMI